MGSPTAFTWRDGERTILFRPGAVADAVEALEEHGWDEYELLSTRRALAGAPLQIPGNAAAVHEVPPGPVNEVAAEIIGDVGAQSLVALGGGRVIDAAKALAAVAGGRVAALPTTLSGAEMTAIHRLPQGYEAPRRVRPQLVLADSAAMTGLEDRPLRASAMNALAHGADCVYTPAANPVSRLAAYRGAKLIAAALDGALDEDGREDLALGSILSAYALDSAGLGLHHVVSQSVVRTMRTSHAETNAAILPRALEALARRVGPPITELARALRTRRAGIGRRIEDLAGGRYGLGDIGGERELIDAALDTMLARPELRRVPDPPARDELRRLLEDAW